MEPIRKNQLSPLIIGIYMKGDRVKDIGTKKKIGKEHG